MVRLKVAIAAVVTAGALAVGLAVPSAASADTAQVVYAWGSNDFGQAGADPAVAGDDLLSPVPVHGAAASVTQLSGPNGSYKGRYVLSLRSDGTVWGWGRNYIGVLGDVVGGSFAPVQIHGLPPDIVQISAGALHAAALAADGSVWTWGSNVFDQLGYATPGAQYSTVPHQVPGVSGVRQIAAGADFTVALRTNGEVWTWGGNDHGQLGDGTHISRITPARNQAPYGMTQVSAGGFYALARRAGSVWAWGANNAGQLGNGSAAADSASPVIVDRRTQNATQTVAGYEHAFAVDPDGSLWAWGANDKGELGLGTAGPAVRTPQKVPGLSGVTQLAAAAQISVALRSDGTLLAWGDETDGLRGDGIARSTPLPVPTPVTPVSGVTLIALSGSTVLVRAPVVTMPDVVGAVRAGAVAQLQAIGLSVQVTTVSDLPICNRVGTVESQTPQAGTVVAPGGHATIRVYVPPSGGCL